MLIRSIALVTAALAAFAATAGAHAEGADYYRGGWRTDAGEPHVYQFVIRGNRVSGVYCTQCADGTTLAPIVGTFDEATGLAFTIRHLRLDGSLMSEDLATARLVKGRLIVTGSRGGPGGAAFEHPTIKDPRGPVPSTGPIAVLPPGTTAPPLLKPASGIGRAPPYVPPAPWRSLTAADVVGVWLGFGVGMDKQYFIIRRDGGGLFGVACGRCDNPYTFGALENFRIDGDTLSFDIVHQDWGDGTILPFDRHVTAHIAMNEMRMDARRPDQTGPGIVASLVGPIAIEATAGNVVAEPAK
ncbi:hypothetical protein [Sphingobium nicotianae]|uniref:DUF2147 domain-containing protein n=1 Tax=Sphingobium nicotianae TaxID=2782607 RepID=A0A9X1DFX6_9SPHN|nr:hypothetical protein [Sphingobium nicotianae]MBT2189126.1 hypothetical protein [Sphingobium nicotianae]